MEFNLNAPDPQRIEFAPLLDSGVTTHEAGFRVGVSATTARRWEVFYRTGGLAMLAPVATRAVYPSHVKRAAVLARLSGLGEMETLERFGLRSAGALGRWVTVYLRDGDRGLGMKEQPHPADALGARSPEHDAERRAAFAASVDAGSGYESASRTVGIPVSTGWAWYQRHRAGNLIGLGSVSERMSYAPALKLAAARAVVDAGDTRADVLLRLGIRSPSTLDDWIRLYRVHGAEAFVPRRISRRSSAATQQDGALAGILEQLDPTISTAMKVKLVSSLAAKYPVRPLLRALKLAPSTYYYRRSRSPIDRYAEVRPLLREAQRRSYGAYVVTATSSWSPSQK